MISNFRRCFPILPPPSLPLWHSRTFFWTRMLFLRLSTPGYGHCTMEAMLALQTVARICPIESSQQLEHFLSFSQFADLLKSKNTTYTRICRALLHILLNIRQDDYAALWQPDGIPYLRVLGFRRNSSALLSCHQKRSIRSFDYQSCRCFFYPSWNCIQTFFTRCSLC